MLESDHDDSKFVGCAIVGNAKLIVTDDRHFDEIDKRSFPKVFYAKLDF